jgi:hypothetical protein
MPDITDLLRRHALWEPLPGLGKLYNEPIREGDGAILEGQR